MLGFVVKNRFMTIGTNALWKSYIDTIEVNLSGKLFGPKYHNIIKDLYGEGKLRIRNTDSALQEVNNIKNKLSDLSTKKFVYSKNSKLSKSPSDLNLDDNASNLYEMFVSVNGYNLTDLLLKALHLSKELQWDLLVCEEFCHPKDNPKADQDIRVW